MRTLLGVVFLSFTVVHARQTDIFPLPDIVKVLTSEPLEGVGEVCKKHLEEYSAGILNLKDWALRMVDSITKFPDGILAGQLSVPGHFDECVETTNELFSGKHCMMNVKADPDYFRKRDISFLEKLSMSYGICIPSTCNASEIQNAIGSVEELKFLKIVLNEVECSTKELRPFRTEDWVTVGVVAAISIIAVGSTAYDLIQRKFRKNEVPHKLWSSFSLYTNGKQLFSISQSSSQLKCLHGIRFLSMCWVILGHSYFSFLLAPAFNTFKIQEFLSDKSFVPVSYAFVSVDSFFFLSGLLVCLVFFRDMSKKKTFDVPVAFIHRYMRLTPPFAILMLIQATIISRIGNGPYWNVRTDAIEKACRDSWWTGLLYVQNYVDPSAMCLGQAWYLSADMQMYWVSPLILYPLYWFPSFAPFFILLLVLAAAFTNFAIAFVNNLAPSLIAGIGLSDSFLSMNQFELEYTPFHTRMAPWLIGLGTGYIICGIQAKKIRLNLSKPMIILGWIAGLSLLGGSLFGGVRFISGDPNLKVECTKAEAAFYLAFHRVGWALGMGWVVIACVGGFGGPVNSLLSLDIFQPLGKLSYCNFLIHMTLQNYRANSSRTNQYLRHFEVVYAYFADLFISNLISIPVVLLFEIPFTNIDRNFLRKLVLFPLPKPKKEIEKDEKKQEETEKTPEDIEKGKVNPTFNES